MYEFRSIRWLVIPKFSLVVTVLTCECWPPTSSKSDSPMVRFLVHFRDDPEAGLSVMEFVGPMMSVELSRRSAIVAIRFGISQCSSVSFPRLLEFEIDTHSPVVSDRCQGVGNESVPMQNPCCDCDRNASSLDPVTS